MINIKVEFLIRSLVFFFANKNMFNRADRVTVLWAIRSWRSGFDKNRSR